MTRAVCWCRQPSGRTGVMAQAVSGLESVSHRELVSDVFPTLTALHQ